MRLVYATGFSAANYPVGVNRTPATYAPFFKNDMVELTAYNGYSNMVIYPDDVYPDRRFLGLHGLVSALSHNNERFLFPGSGEKNKTMLIHANLCVLKDKVIPNSAPKKAYSFSLLTAKTTQFPRAGSPNTAEMKAMGSAANQRIGAVGSTYLTTPLPGDNFDDSYIYPLNKDDSILLQLTQKISDEHGHAVCGQWFNFQLKIERLSGSNQFRVFTYLNGKLCLDETRSLDDDPIENGFYFATMPKVEGNTQTSIPVTTSPQMAVSDFFYVVGDDVQVLPTDIKVLELPPESDYLVEFDRNEDLFSSNAEVIARQLGENDDVSLTSGAEDATDLYKFGGNLAENASGIVAVGMKVRWRDLGGSGAELGAASELNGEVGVVDSKPATNIFETVFKQVPNKPDGSLWGVSDISSGSFGFNLKDAE